MAFSSVEGLLQVAGQVPLWRAVLEDDLRGAGVDEAHSWRQMAALWTAMKAPVASTTPPPAPAADSLAARGPGWRGRGRGCAPLPAAGDRRRPQNGGVQRLHETHRGRPHGGGQRGACPR